MSLSIPSYVCFLEAIAVAQTKRVHPELYPEILPLNVTWSGSTRSPATTNTRYGPILSSPGATRSRPSYFTHSRTSTKWPAIAAAATAKQTRATHA